VFSAFFRVIIPPQLREPYLTGPKDSKDFQKGGSQNALVVGPSMPSTAA